MVKCRARKREGGEEGRKTRRAGLVESESREEEEVKSSLCDRELASDIKCCWGVSHTRLPANHFGLRGEIVGVGRGISPGLLASDARKKIEKSSHKLGEAYYWLVNIGRF